MKDMKEEKNSSSTSIPTCVIKVNINCCKSCPVKVKKGLLKLSGVNSVVVDPEQYLVYVTGKVEPFEVVTKFAKWGKKARLLSYDKDSMNEDNHVKAEFKKAKPQLHREQKNSESHRKKSHRDYLRHNDFSHVPEPYVQPKELDISNICRDPYCRIHPRNPLIKTTPPVLLGGSRDAMTWHHPQQQYPNHFLRGNPTPRLPYPPLGLPYPGVGYSRISPYEQYNSWMPPPAVEYGNIQRPMPGFDNFNNYFNEESNRSCSIM